MGLVTGAVLFIRATADGFERRAMRRIAVAGSAVHVLRCYRQSHGSAWSVSLRRCARSTGHTTKPGAIFNFG